MTPLARQRLAQRLTQAVRDSARTGTRPTLPDGAGVLWEAFTALHRTRGSGPLGPNPITYAEIEAWCRLARMPLAPHHVEILMAMDAAWMETGGETNAPPASPMNAALFDAVFG